MTGLGIRTSLNLPPFLLIKETARAVQPDANTIFPNTLNIIPFPLPVIFFVLFYEKTI